jgi:signal transduction histidine kinase
MIANIVTWLSIRVATRRLAVARAIIDTRGWHDRVELVGEPVTVTTDPRRLERIVANLVANAVEHSGREVRVVVSAETAGVLVRVNDRGAGIRPEHLARLFDRFYTADTARSGAVAGWAGHRAGERPAARSPTCICGAGSGSAPRSDPR